MCAWEPPPAPGTLLAAWYCPAADAYCPTLRDQVKSQLVAGAECAYEIVIDGTSEQVVGAAMAAGIRAAVGSGVVIVTAGNYGGKLGKYQFHLRKLLAAEA